MHLKYTFISKRCFFNTQRRLLYYICHSLPYDFLIHDLCYTYFSQANTSTHTKTKCIYCACARFSLSLCVSFCCLRFFCFIWIIFAFCHAFVSLSSSSLYSTQEIRYCEKKIWFRNHIEWARVSEWASEELMHKQKLILWAVTRADRFLSLKCDCIYFSSVIFALKMIFWKAIFGANTHTHRETERDWVYINYVCICVCILFMYFDLLSTFECGPFLHPINGSTSFNR